MCNYTFLESFEGCQAWLAKPNFIQKFPDKKLSDRAAADRFNETAVCDDLLNEFGEGLG